MTTDISGNSPEATPCLRCGVCCEEIFIPLNMAEARHIADCMAIDWEAWLDRYIDGGLDDDDTLFLSKVNGVCIFLERGSINSLALCTIHDCKPSACRNWAPDPRGRYCQQGQHRRLDHGDQPVASLTPTRTTHGGLPG